MFSRIYWSIRLCLDEWICKAKGKRLALDLVCFGRQAYEIRLVVRRRLGSATETLVLREVDRLGL